MVAIIELPSPSCCQVVTSKKYFVKLLWTVVKLSSICRQIVIRILPTYYLDCHNIIICCPLLDMDMDMDMDCVIV